MRSRGGSRAAPTTTGQMGPRTPPFGPSNRGADTCHGGSGTRKMRISNRAYLDALQRGLVKAAEGMQRLSVQLSSSRRLQRPSEDPVAAGVILRAHTDLHHFKQQQETLAAALNRVYAADSPLGQISQQLVEAKNIALQGLSSSLPPDALQPLANQIQGILEYLVDEANKSVIGRYLFAGTEDNAAPVVWDPVTEQYQYAGNDSYQLAPVAPGRTAPTNIPGVYVFNFVDSEGNRVVPEVDADLFTVLQQAEQQIRSGDTDALRETAEQLDALHSNVVTQRGILGGHALRLETAQNAAADGEITISQLLASTEEVDIVEAILKMQRLELTYQAALAAVGKIASLPTIFQVWQ